MYCGVFPGSSDGKESACSVLCTLLDRMLCNGKWIRTSFIVCKTSLWDFRGRDCPMLSMPRWAGFGFLLRDWGCVGSTVKYKGGQGPREGWCVVQAPGVELSHASGSEDSEAPTWRGFSHPGGRGHLQWSRYLGANGHYKLSSAHSMVRIDLSDYADISWFSALTVWFPQIVALDMNPESCSRFGI